MGVSERTNVIVVGAGASKEFSLPTGAELLEKIEQFADLGFRSGSEFYGDHRIFEAFRLLAQKRGVHHNEYLRAARFLKKNMAIAPSIDNFLHTHKDKEIIVEVGKILIAKSISEAEEGSTIYTDPKLRSGGIQFSHQRSKSELKPNWSWLGELFRLLASGRNINDFIQALGNITFVSFNYDRCISHFLISAAQQYFDCSADQIEEVENALLVLHPYGSLGPLNITAEGVRGFGDKLDGTKLCDAMLGLKTFTEGLADEYTERQIRDAFAGCDVTIFLGFGFLPLNLHRLFGKERFEVQKVIGTSKGISEESTKLLRRELIDALFLGDARPEYHSFRRESANTKISLDNVTCAELFQKHNRFLMLNS